MKAKNKKTGEITNVYWMQGDHALYPNCIADDVDPSSQVYNAKTEDYELLYEEHGDRISFIRLIWHIIGVALLLPLMIIGRLYSLTRTR